MTNIRTVLKQGLKQGIKGVYLGRSTSSLGKTISYLKESRIRGLWNRLLSSSKTQSLDAISASQAKVIYRNARIAAYLYAALLLVEIIYLVFIAEFIVVLTSIMYINFVFLTFVLFMQGSVICRQIRTGQKFTLLTWLLEPHRWLPGKYQKEGE